MDDIKKETKDVKEWHFHCYFTNEQIEEATAFRKNIVKNVVNEEFVVVCNGITLDIMPNLGKQVKRVPNFNLKPIGPHVTCSFEIWVPIESLEIFKKFCIDERGELTIFIHPLSRDELKDHTTDAIFLGKEYKLKTEVLSETLDYIPLQYSNLGLGYSKKK